jgi:hypothetical protein
MAFLQFGTKITSSGDPLQKIELDRLYLGIHKPKQRFRDLIDQLRMVKTMSIIEYRELKKQLPYFVCGIFHPPVRRRENFAVIQYFMLDIDHLESAQMDKEHLAASLKEIPEVVLLFTSPSEDGLKIMFKLSEKCSDQALFTSFYKVFTKHFAEKHHLAQVIDFKTSDVTRACFFSYDPEAYFNPDAIPVDMNDYLSGLNFDLAEQDLKEADRFIRELPKSEKQNLSLDQEILKNIKDKLHPGYRKPAGKTYYIPPEVDTALPLLNEALSEFDIKITETEAIHYGRKLKVVSKQLWAELNIFYGKKGFKVVPTTKSGSHQELATLAAQAVTQILSTLEIK